MLRKGVTMSASFLIHTATRAVALASLVLLGSGCGGSTEGVPKPAMLSEEEVRQADQAARSAAEAEGAAAENQPPAK
jgi:hypothetical protein